MNPYMLLSVPTTATEREIRDAWRAKVREWHPDRSKNPLAKWMTAHINEAAETLLDPEKRKKLNLRLLLEALAAAPKEKPLPAATQPKPGPFTELAALRARDMGVLEGALFILMGAALDRELGTDRSPFRRG